MNVFVRTISFTKPVTGQRVMDAVKHTCGQLEFRYVEVAFYQEERVFQVGATSASPDRHFLVEPEAGGFFSPAREYEQIVVKDYEWGGIVYAVNYSNADVVREGESFAGVLEQSFDEGAISP